MKKQLILIGAMLLFGSFLFGQNAEPSEHFSKKNAIKISPVEFGHAEFQMAYERYFGERSSSITISPSVTLKDNFEEVKTGYQLMGQYRFFLTHLRKDHGREFLGFHNIGFYAGVYGLYMDYTEDYMYYQWDPVTQQDQYLDLTKESTSIEGGAILGFQIDVTKRILFDVFVGGGVRQTEITDERDDLPDPNYYESYGVFDPEYKGVKPKIGFQVGITF